jgi:hypothetical protein
MTVLDLAPERRALALRKIDMMHRVIAIASGHTEAEAAASALNRKERIQNAVGAIEVSGGGAGGSG